MKEYRAGKCNVCCKEDPRINEFGLCESCQRECDEVEAEMEAEDAKKPKIRSKKCLGM